MSWVNDLLGWKPDPNAPVETPAEPEPIPPTLVSLGQQYDLIMGALTVWREARGEPREGQVAVWHVILNRVGLGGGASIAEVVTEPKQFSCFNQDDSQVTLWPKRGDATWQTALSIVTGFDPNPVGNARYYFNPDLANPEWARRLVLVAKIGRHVFYRDP